MLDSISLDQLRAFILVADEGSFSAAGRRLSRVQSAISQAIHNLEQNLGVELFLRTSKKPVLSKAGRAMLPQARQVVREAGVLRAQAAALRKGAESALTLAVDNLFPSQNLLVSLDALRQQFPDLLVTLYTAPLFAAEQRLRGGQADLALCSVRPFEVPDLVATPLTTIAMLPVAAESHPLGRHHGKLSRDMLGRHIQLVLTDPSTTPTVGVIGSRVWRFVDLTWRLEFLRAGFGWCNMPAHLVSQDIAAGELKILNLEEPNLLPGAIPMHAIHARDRPPGLAGSWLLNHLIAAFDAGGDKQGPAALLT